MYQLRGQISLMIQIQVLLIILGILNYGTDAKETWMQSTLYTKDDAGQLDNFKIKADNQSKTNNGYLKRRLLLSSNKWSVETIVPLHLDFFQIWKTFKK